MSDSNATKLMPCPICGGQPDFQHFNIATDMRCRIICSCGLEIRQGKNETEDDIRIIWNTRTGRGECVMKFVKFVDAYEVFECSSCGERILMGREPKFCSQCGKAVKP